jgi:hypothetical protein
MSRAYIVLIFSVLILATLPSTSFSHSPVDRVSEAQTGQARLFAADAATGEIIAIDLPDGDTVVRLTTPPYVMQLGLSSDGQHLFALRGSSTDRDWVTIIHTGFDVTNGEVRPPYVARTFLGFDPGSVNNGSLATVGGKDAIFMEGTGEIIVFEGNGFTGFDEVKVRKYKLAGPTHYHYLEVGDNLYVGHLNQAFVQVLNRESGAEVARISGCPRLHGKALDEPTGRLFFPCLSDVMVIGTQGEEANREVARISYPERQRVASFLKGKDRVFWGYTEGILPVLYRLDAAREPYAFETLPVEASIRQNVTEDGNLLLVLTKTGVLEIRDGGSGELIRKVTVSKPFEKELRESVGQAILPDIVTFGDRAYVSLPHEGRIAEVHLTDGTVIRHLQVGGEPTRIVLVVAKDAD